MSPFGRKHDEDHAVMSSESGPDGTGDLEPEDQESSAQLDAELARLSSLSLPQLACEVMAKGFTAAYDPGARGREVGDLTEKYSPSPPVKLKDLGLKAQREADAEAQDPSSPRAKRLQLEDLLAEGMQALEKALLVRVAENFYGEMTHFGYKTTRLGRAALQQNAVERIVSGGTLSS
jgi:hypothetical protein